MGAFFGIRPIIGVVAALSFAAWFATSAHAATYTVGTMSDSTGTCQSPSNGTCSLRQLIDYENALPSTPSPPDTIAVPAGYDIDLQNGSLTITRSMSIVGAGANSSTVLQGSDTPDRVFFIHALQAGAVPTVTIAGLWIADGNANANNGYYGGNVENQGNLTLSGDTIIGGSTTSGSGGGIGNDGGTVTVAHSLVYDNESLDDDGGGDSGGIQNYGPNPVTGTPGTLIVTDSAIAGNDAALGGGIFSWCGGGGGDPCAQSGAATNTTTITNSTIADNDGGDRQSPPANGGGLYASQGSISVQNSIVAGNFVTNANGAESASNCGKSSPGTITSLGYNLETGTDCGFKSTGDLQSANPLFTSAVPEDNGGDTSTLGIDAKSPAVDAIPVGAPGCGGTDQRGVSRPQGTGCDMGAFEVFQPVEGQSAVIQVADACCSISEQPTITWGDGTTPSQGSVSQDGGPITGTHTYVEAGIYTGSVSWQDDGGSHTVAFDVKVVDAPLTATAIPVSTAAGTQFSGPVATFTDANPDGTVSEYSATIDWGDGSTTSAAAVTAGAGDFVVSGSHTYASAGTYQTTVTIDDVGGSTATAIGTATAAGAPAPVTTGAPTVTGPNGAAFSGSVNPSGLTTTAYFQYGIPPNAQGPEGASPTFSQVTPTQTVGSDFSDHAVSAAVSGLVPNELYDVQLVATNSAGTSYGPVEPFTTTANNPPPAPVLGQQVNVQLVSGHVWIKPPPGKSLGAAGDRAALSKGQGFVPLTEARQVPTGSEVDALHGSLKIVSNTGKVGKTQTATLAGGVFKVTQVRKGITKGQTDFNLIESAFQGAPTYATCKANYKKSGDATIASLSSKTLQLLKVSGHGKFRTTGRYSSATVRGTIYTVADKCNGTLTHVIRDTVLVDDFARHKVILLHAGQSYLAKKP
jgi:hypothetical protein